jgi:NAD(P)-dependent dehydrogenase (short-subunit alcohol dehydrogenase family)
MARYDLDGKVALVTGAARGIGYETARALYARGAVVTLVDLDLDATEAASRRIGNGTMALEVDVTHRDAMRHAVEATVDVYGGLDVCVANAGTVAHFATLRAMSADAAERVISVNLLGAYNTIHAALPQVAARGGHFALVASIYAFTNGLFVAPYAASKAGVEQLGRALRTELAPHGASATVAYYGFIDTEMVRQTFDVDPISVRVHQLAPRPLRKHLTAEQGAAALVRGIERRKARVIAPRRWAALSTLRGLVNPLIDERLARDPLVRAVIAEADVPERVAGPQLIRAAGETR